MDIRQSQEWGDFLSSIGWTIYRPKGRQIFVRRLPFLNCSLIKIQRPQNPLPLKEIEQIAKKEKALFVLIEPDIIKFDEQKLKDYGFRKSKMTSAHTATIEIDLQKSLSKIFAGFSENARRNVRKALKNNLEIKLLNLKDTADDQEFQKFFSLLNNLTKMKKFYIPGYNQFYKKMLAFKNSSTILFAYQKGNSQPIASVWLGYFGKTAVYMQTGITERGYQTLANYLLVWEALKLAKKKGLKVFDFEGIFDPRFPKERRSWIKFSEFKKRFHGQIIEYPEAQIKCYNPLFKYFYLGATFFQRP